MPTTFSPIDWEDYDVNATDLSGVVDAISDLPEAGSCEWIPAWDISTDDDGLVTGATITIEIRITLPEWLEESQAGDAERQEWQRFLEALREHEMGHHRIVLEQLERLDERMIGISQSDAEQVFADALDDLQTASNDYDSLTDHGRNDGTVIEIPG